jgi:hypothetical protein
MKLDVDSMIAESNISGLAFYYPFFDPLLPCNLIWACFVMLTKLKGQQI